MLRKPAYNAISTPHYLTMHLDRPCITSMLSNLGIWSAESFYTQWKATMAFPVSSAGHPRNCLNQWRWFGLYIRPCAQQQFRTSPDWIYIYISTQYSRLKILRAHLSCFRSFHNLLPCSHSFQALPLFLLMLQEVEPTNEFRRLCQDIYVWQCRVTGREAPTVRIF